MTTDRQTMEATKPQTKLFHCSIIAFRILGEFGYNSQSWHKFTKFFKLLNLLLSPSGLINNLLNIHSSNKYLYKIDLNRSAVIPI